MRVCACVRVRVRVRVSMCVHLRVWVCECLCVCSYPVNEMKDTVVTFEWMNQGEGEGEGGADDVVQAAKVRMCIRELFHEFPSTYICDSMCMSVHMYVGICIFTAKHMNMHTCNIIVRIPVYHSTVSPCIYA